jgi:exopolyphosphatase/guanosine-5'-triphosphate,3'-diphosphate pyrophosphatase
VVDVGGGSAQIAVGTHITGPTWIRSIEIGSMRLTSRYLHDDPPQGDALALARAEVERLLRSVTPPMPQVCLAVGGSARALRRVMGTTQLRRDRLAEAAALVGSTPAEEVARRFGLAPRRARTLAAGAIILSAIADVLGVGFRVVQAGIREGAVLELERALA